MDEPGSQGALSQPPSVRPWWVLVTLCWSLLVIGLNTTGINTAIGVIAEDFEMSTTAVAWAVNAYLLAAATTVAAGGQFGDVLGRRRMFAIGLGLFAVGSATIAAAPGPEVLVAGRAFQGMASGLMLPAQLALVRLVFPEAKQGTAVGIWAATASFTFAVGPLYGGAFADTVGWRWLFAADLLLLAVGGVLAWLFLLPVRERVSGARPDLVGAASLGVATIAAIVVLQQGGSWGWTGPLTLGVAVLGIASGVVFVLAEARTDDPLVHFSLFRSRAYSAGVITTFAQGFGLMGLLYFVSIFTESAATYDLSALEAGLVLVPGGLVMFISALVGGRVADRVGYRVPNTVAMLLGGIGALALAGTVEPGTSTTSLALVATITAAGVGIGFSTTSAAGMVAVPSAVSGEAGGVINMSRYVGTVLVVAVGTVLYTQVAQDRLDDDLGPLGVSSSEELSVDRAMGQSAGELQKAVDALPESEQSEVTAAVRSASVDGFRWAEAMIALVLLAAAVASWVLLGTRRGESVEA